MTESPDSLETPPARTGASPWTCPFCLLLCDSATVEASADGSLLLRGPACECATRALARFRATPSQAQPLVDGAPATLADAIAAAARFLKASRQPLFGGLGTDVAGARALYRLASLTGAISDASGGGPLAQGLRVLQDRGQYTTTLAEVRTRADLIVCLPGLPLAQAPTFFDRCGVGEAQVLAPLRHIAMLGGSTEEAAALEALAERPGVSVEALPLHEGDIFTTAAILAALVAGRSVANAPQSLQALAERLQQARYAVIVGEPARLPDHGALAMEAINRIVGLLNLRTRAGVMWLGGGNGASTANQVYTWLSGLPLRSRAGPLGLEHEPLCFGAERLLADGAVDSLLWISSFDPDSVPPQTDLPLIVIGHPELPVKGSVFIPVSTPGIGSAGHLFRADGVVMLPLFPVYADTLPTLSQVLAQIAGALQS